MFIELHRFTGPGIPRNARFPLLRPEGPEATDLDVVTIRECIGNGLEKTVDQNFGLELRHAGRRGNAVYNISFRHRDLRIKGSRTAGRLCSSPYN